MTSHQDDNPLLDERKATILRSVVAEYIETAQPVGSSHVVRSTGLGVSAATVRNEMAALEEEGYLAQPHTSAGRVPTDKGYRFFVDQLPVAEELAGRNRETVRQFFARAHGELEKLLGETSKLVSTLTRYAAVVVGPDHDSATVRSAQLVHLGSRSVLAVLVLSDGAVVKHALELDEDIAQSDVEEASSLWSSQLVGTPTSSLGSLEDPAEPAGSAASRMVAAANALMSPAAGRDDPDRLFVGGASRMAESFEAIETVRSVLSILEQQFIVVNLLRGVLDSDRLGVAIGHEHGVEPLADCAVVVAPYRFANDEMGLIGVLGPTRMHYAKTMSTVAAVGAELESCLVEG